MAKKKSKKKINKSTRTALHLTNSKTNILKSLFELPVYQNWLDNDVIDKINRDSTVTAAIGSRKAATLKKEIIVTCKDETIKTNMEQIFNYDTLDSILDTPYQGFGVFEINWINKDYTWYPHLIERHYQDFILTNGALQYLQDGIPVNINKGKSIHAVYRAKPLKPYGQPLYNPLFWLIEFKNASMEFWIELLERFGTPWVIAKTDDDKNKLADEIYNMLGGDGAVLGPDDTLELKTADKVGNFKEIIEYIDNQIREIILGGNLTGQVKGGSQAAATVHNDIREDLARADENILINIIKTTVRYFKEVNNYTDELTIELKDKDDPNIELSQRDEAIHRMGYKPTKDYIEKTYNIEVDVIDQEIKKPFENKRINRNTSEALNAESYKLMQFSTALSTDELEYQTKQIDTINPLTFQKQILETIEKCTSYEELQDKLLEIYPDVDTQDLEELLFKNIANADILGRAKIEEENPNG